MTILGPILVVYATGLIVSPIIITSERLRFGTTTKEGLVVASVLFALLPRC